MAPHAVLVFGRYPPTCLVTSDHRVLQVDRVVGSLPDGTRVRATGPDTAEWVRMRSLDPMLSGWVRRADIDELRRR
jgi:hypothetical protein